MFERDTRSPFINLFDSICLVILQLMLDAGLSLWQAWPVECSMSTFPASESIHETNKENRTRKGKRKEEAHNCTDRNGTGTVLTYLHIWTVVWCRNNFLSFLLLFIFFSGSRLFLFKQTEKKRIAVSCRYHKIVYYAYFLPNLLTYFCLLLVRLVFCWWNLRPPCFFLQRRRNNSLTSTAQPYLYNQQRTN